MNEVVTKQNGGKKLRQMKEKIADLRGIIACCKDPADIRELQQMLSGARFMHDIYEVGVLKDSRIAAACKLTRAKRRWVVKWLVKAVTVAVLLAIIFLSQGCQTLEGVKGDIHWLTADVEHSKQ